MSRTTNESDDGMLSKDQTGSPSIDEGSSGGTILKKGPWTASEDAILMEYVKKHGEGNWNAVQKHSGLFRCGKSCRLRWANHLRPNLKKGAFTAEEERMIIELHAKMGNKWARMAAHLPGRTDNEIKNYWNTRIKRRQRAGLPLYPPELCLQTLNEGQQNQSAGEFSSRESQHHVLQSNNYDIPEVVFDNLKTNPLSFAPFPDISVSSMLTQGLVPPQSYSFMPSMFSRSKRIRESESLMPSFSETLPNGISLFDQLSHEPCEKIHHRTFNMGGGFYYDTNPTSKNQTPFGGLSGSHAFLNGNFTAASKPISGPVKLELPSIQFQELETGLDLWGATSPPPPPSLEAVDTYIQSPPPTIQVQADCISPRDSGLLEALLHEARTRNSGKNHSSEKCSSSSVVTPAEMDSSELNFCDREWGEYGDPISPVAHSAASVFSECTPSCSSFDRTPPDEALLGRKIKIEKVDLDLPSDVEVKDTSTCLDFSRPDALLNADWFDQNECAKDLAALLSDDFCDDCKPVAGGTTSSSQNEGWGYGSCSWNNMTTAVYQMSELP